MRSVVAEGVVVRLIRLGLPYPCCINIRGSGARGRPITVNRNDAAS